MYIVTHVCVVFYYLLRLIQLHNHVCRRKWGASGGGSCSDALVTVVNTASLVYCFIALKRRAGCVQGEEVHEVCDE